MNTELRLVLKDSRPVNGIMKYPDTILGEVILAEGVRDDDVDKAIACGQVRVLLPGVRTNAERHAEEQAAKDKELEAQKAAKAAEGERKGKGGGK